MKPRGSSSHKAIALLIVFSFMQFYVVFALAGPSLARETTTTMLPVVAPQAIMGKLATRGNQPVLVNGNNASTGATILSGATIETGDQVGASIHLGPLGTIDIAPNSKVQIEFSNGQIKVTVIQGCVIVKNNKGTFAQILTDKGVAASNDPNQKPAAVLDVCYPSGAPNPIVNQGAAANAGAGAGAGAAGGGLSPGEWAAIILGGAAAVGVPVALHRGRNPSPGTPRGAP
ncbi:MAG: hypothetical protein QOH63_3333 [Acidobacteriota bacterium]|jgi:hypothetical protein|nr:hypothetical protein [Acidobacteriota bacterium]